MPGELTMMPDDGEGCSRRADGLKRVMWKFLQLSPRCACRVVQSLAIWVRVDRGTRGWTAFGGQRAGGVFFFWSPLPFPGYFRSPQLPTYLSIQPFLAL